MDYHKDIESTLNALLLNATELEESGDNQISSAELSDQQQRLLDNLFNQWNHLSEDEKKALLETEIENQVHELAKKNQACLREVGSRISYKRYSSTSQQLDLNL